MLPNQPGRLGWQYVFSFMRGTVKVLEETCYFSLDGLVLYRWLAYVRLHAMIDGLEAFIFAHELENFPGYRI